MPYRDKEKQLQYWKEYRLANKEKLAAYHVVHREKKIAARAACHDRRRVRSNGIPPNIGRCYACHIEGKMNIGKGKGLYVDHCHIVGDINRGLLCHACNIAEGHYAKGILGPSAKMPEHLVVYLQRFANGWHVGDGLARLKEQIAELEGVS